MSELRIDTPVYLGEHIIGHENGLQNICTGYILCGFPVRLCFYEKRPYWGTTGYIIIPETDIWPTTNREEYRPEMHDRKELKEAIETLRMIEKTLPWYRRVILMMWRLYNNNRSIR